nr:aspartate/glutamate racemase family protein [Bacilliculturomica massiliensis]
MEENRQYGILNEQTNNLPICQKIGQVTAAAPIGILCLEDIWIPVVPGNVMNGFTYNFPVQYEFVKGLDNKSIFAGKEEVYEGILTACKELKKHGVRAITGACGFFGHYHSRLAAELDIPVALSSLVQLPWIASMLQPHEKIGVLTAHEESLTPSILKNCNVPDDVAARLVIRGMGKEPEFSTIIDDTGMFNNEGVKKEMAGKALEMVQEHPEIGAFLLECTEMPPYAHLIQAATQRPVYDFITLINWMFSGVCRAPFSGWM